MKYILILMLMLMLMVDDVFACSCYRGEDEFEKMAENATYIFIGKRLSKNIFSSFSYSKYKFEVKERFKGPDQETIIFKSSKFFFPCSKSLNKNKLYVIHVYSKKDDLEISSCSTWDIEVYKKFTSDFREYHSKTRTLTNKSSGTFRQ